MAWKAEVLISEWQHSIRDMRALVTKKIGPQCVYVSDGAVALFIRVLHTVSSTIRPSYLVNIYFYM